MERGTTAPQRRRDEPRAEVGAGRTHAVVEARWGQRMPLSQPMSTCSRDPVVTVTATAIQRGYGLWLATTSWYLPGATASENSPAVLVRVSELIVPPARSARTSAFGTGRPAHGCPASSTGHEGLTLTTPEISPGACVPGWDAPGCAAPPPQDARTTQSTPANKAVETRPGDDERW